jgi:protein O-mannosyl-transferase
MHWPSPLIANKYRFVLSVSIFVIAVTVFLAYANSFNASWHFDDYNNIHTNSKLHLSDLDPEALYNTLFANPLFPEQQRLYRPLSNLTFALNWYWSGEDVWGYHVVNVFIHTVTAVFLFLVICCLYRTPALEAASINQASKIAFFAALLWALNPIQTQAVTYIVQRMASLAAMLYIMAIYTYLKARLSPNVANKIGFGCSTLLFALLAMGSKENAVTLPLCLVLIEMVFFKTRQRLKALYAFALLAAIALFTIACLLYVKGDPLAFLSGYESRSFTLTERLLTEPRIVLFYLSQIFYPAVFRLSLEHDILLSKSLFVPWTTLPAICILILIVVHSFSKIQTKPFLSFSLLFFLLNHAVESTVLPLELIFEHRNYLPSMFLFVPLIDFACTKELTLYKRNILSYPLVTISLVFTAVLFGTGTYLRNMDWKSERTLWQDTLYKAPLSARAAYNLGKVYLDTGLYDEALALFNRAEERYATAPIPKLLQCLVFNGKGSVFLLTGQPERALQYFERALSTDENYSLSRFNLALTFLSMRNIHEADRNLQLLVNKNATHPDYYYLSKIIQGLKHPQQTDRYQENKHLSNPTNKNLLILLSIVHKNNKNYSESEILCKKYLDNFQNDKMGNFLLIELFDMQNKIKERDELIDKIQKNTSRFELINSHNNNKMLGFEIFSKERIEKLFGMQQ